MKTLHFGRTALAAALVVGAFGAVAQTAPAAPAKPATKPAATKVAKAAPQVRKAPKAKNVVPAAPEVTEPMSEGQLQAASRVYTGQSQCEFNQSVSIQPVQDKPGHFKVGFNKASYTMTPQETTTGAVRLEDKKNGIVWLQIPTKSMMMNQKIGQRMVDGCMHAEQSAAVAAAK